MHPPDPILGICTGSAGMGCFRLPDHSTWHTAVLPTRPTRMRLSKCRPPNAISDKMEDWAVKMQACRRIGEYSITERTPLGFKASIYSRKRPSVPISVVELRCARKLPATRTGGQHRADLWFPYRSGAARSWWSRIPAVCLTSSSRRSSNDIVSRSRPLCRRPNVRPKAPWDHAISRDKGLLRVGAQVENLHDALQVASRTVAHVRAARLAGAARRLTTFETQDELTWRYDGPEYDSGHHADGRR